MTRRTRRPRRGPRAAARLTLLAGGIVMAGAALTGCGRVDVDGAEPEHRAFALGGRTLTVDNDDSRIELVPGKKGKKGKEVEVTRWFDGWSVGGSTRTSWEMDGDTLRLRQECGGISKHCEAKHRIEVPPGVTVIVKDENGGVTSKGIKGDLRFTSDNGDLDVRGADGRLTLTTENGDIRAVDAIDSRRVSARSDNGNVTVRPRRAPDRVDGESVNGDVTVTVPGETTYRVDAKSVNGSVKVGVGRDDSAGRSVRARSDNGDVAVRAGG
ncbi:DUF4097 family beta strand repeat protein [Streptomyces sp. AV19]|uniref:DUF4097 family beta strand repeat-containing protein n=1 Tax=Streptomyces sp. AV19 TaxID=2793068 RepID=UPI0018FEF073|nr:DUF4097 family beta strand repeat-containing protein [Streptomyces sp. AV19]MBH1933377.1 DUF4097 family beta strand repeat protein [Streptomyces sp. AV19]MDG4531988.1 DUF4097 domain-containing protein [Streptomyces sp. AV19]